MIVAVQLFSGVNGSIAVPALAGYVLTASGISSRGVSTLVCQFNKAVDHVDWRRRFPEGKSQVSGYKLAGSVFVRSGEVMGDPVGGKNS